MGWRELMSPMRERLSAAAEVLPASIRRCSCGSRPLGHAPCTACARRAKKRISRHATGHVVLDDELRWRVLAVLRSPGEPLDRAARNDMEAAFNAPFEQVRIHRDRRAAETAARLSASAYTVGRHIVFAAGRYAPVTAAGRELLAHELAHVLQQRVSDNFSNDLVVGPEDDRFEREAVEAARAVSDGDVAVLSGTPTLSVRSAATVVQRQAKKICGPDV